MAYIADENFACIVRHGILPSLDIILRDSSGRIFVGLRMNEPAKGFYFVPGGVIRKNERIAQAFSRILTTETSLTAPFDGARFVGIYEHFYSTNRYGNPRFGTHYLVLGYEVSVGATPEIALDTQHTDYRWMEEATLLAAPDVHENTKAYFSLR